MNPPKGKAEEEFAKELGEEHGSETASKHSWQNHRKRNLKQLGLWEKVEE